MAWAPYCGSSSRRRWRVRCSWKRIGWTGTEAFADGIVDVLAPDCDMLKAALDLGRSCAPRAKMDVFGLLRSELYGEADGKFQAISYVHSKATSRQVRGKL